MQKLKFLFGTHCHQPVGNFEHIFSEAYERAYLPFLETMAKHPRIKFAVHYSGVLYDWFKKNRPEIYDLLRKLVKRGQIEILSGGYYEPILSVIPDEDKFGQIEMSNQFIKENFLRAPQGLWLTEHVWEPSLPKVLARSGIEYTLVDDDNFIRANVDPDKLFGYYLTEDEGEIVKLFPISRRLRELIPFRSPEKVIAYLKSIPNPDGNAAVVFFDDGEKFGFRPETHKRVYEEGYLEKLLTLLEENSSWLEFTNFSDYLDEYAAQGRIYLPATSYFEMMKWSLPAEFDAERDGFYRNFFVKYPEANNLHKKMLNVSSRLKIICKGKSLFGKQPKAAEIERARKELYQGQCSCAYWHAMFGGLYLNYLRHGVYTHLIKAEVELEQLSRAGKPFVELSLTDIDKDGQDEVILANNLLNLYFSPARGGSLYELDYKPKFYNLLNTLARREENYQDGLSRCSLIDHFLSSTTGLAEFSVSGQGEVGDFVAGNYLVMPSRKESEVGLRLSRQGRVEGSLVKVEKTISLFAKQSIINIEYEVSNLGEEPDEFWFGPEFNFSLLAGYAADRYYQIAGRTLAEQNLASSGEEAEASSVKLVDEGSGFDVSLTMSKPALLWRFPIETISQSESGVEKMYQSSVVLPTWKFRLGPKASWSVKITLRIEE
ncbi:MAG: DUF1926 domain-containing protein [Candidatus Margulisbacteria bacterium]|nr:DUF1926 domain-containing protein [Candidatus Margulisiibacteriota bacterium]